MNLTKLLKNQNIIKRIREVQGHGYKQQVYNAKVILGNMDKRIKELKDELTLAVNHRIQFAQSMEVKNENLH